MATITSGIPGDINQVKRRQSATDPAGIQQLTRQSLQPQAGITSVAQPTQPRPSPLLPGDPARAARMQAQMSQPVTKVEQGPGTGDRLLQGVKDAFGVAKPLLMPAATAAGILAAPVIDAGRNTVIRAAGGDPNTAEGGSTKYQDRAFGEIQPALKAAEAVGDATRRGAGNAVLSITGAKPAATAQAPGSSTPSASIAALPDKPALPATSKPGSATASMPPAAGNGYQNTGIAGVVGRRGANGQLEFTNDSTSVAGASGQLNGYGDGSGTFSVMGRAGDSKLALDRFERANIERGRMVGILGKGEIGSGSGGVVADSGAVDRALRTARISGASLPGIGNSVRQPKGEGGATSIAAIDPALEAQGRSKALIDQAIAEQDLRDRQSRSKSIARLESLQDVMADLNASPEQRASARAAYTELTTPAKDRYVLQDTVLASDPISGPKYGKQAIDVITGQPVAGGAAQFPGAPQPGFQKDGYTFLGGDPADQRNWRKG
ncbi:hypothetical protein I5F71_02735 [Pseudomonas aeruginosa]|nr:hypothetical protein [Pseudomonas aeruginosa]MBG4718163.1 hypothetical protein [Pseudomonas aeruginosa]